VTGPGDDVIHCIEDPATLMFSGSSDGLASGSALTVTVNGKTYCSNVLAEGSWSVSYTHLQLPTIA
ncbi:hypothetical protein, partial [Enterobacter hormaechei]